MKKKMPRKIPTAREELAKKVIAYLRRAKKDSLLESYSIEEKGFYKIVGGSRGDYGHREDVGIYRGRYIDVVAEAVQLYDFYADWCSTDDPDNCNHGYVEKYEQDPVVKVRVNQGLVKLINMFQGFEKEKKGLEKRLAKINKAVGGK